MAARRAHTASTRSGDLPILPRPDLLVLKLLAGWPQAFADGVRVLRDTPVAEREATADLIAGVASAHGAAFQALCTLSDADFWPVSARHLPSI